jgi:hypothetical protein
MERTNNIVKNIEIQQKFADLIFKDFRSKRFGINTCCSIDQKNKYSIQKAICDWDNKIKPTYTKSYTETDWINCTKPIPEWVLYGDYTPAETNCPPCNHFPAKEDTRCWLTVQFMKANVMLWPNESGEAKLICQASRTPGDEESWMTVGSCTFPTFAEGVNPQTGAPTIITTDNTDGVFNDDTVGCCRWIEDPLDPKTSILEFKVYHDGALKSDSIRWFIDDPVVDPGRKVYSFEVEDQDWEQYAGTIYNIYPNASGRCPETPGRFDEYRCRFPNPIELICTEDPCERCVFCGEGWPAVDTPIDGTAPTLTTLESPECKCDSECILFTVKDGCGNLIPNWEIHLDGGSIGQTNDQGILVHTIEKASENNKHALDICGFCFTTTGNCNQKKIDIVVDDGSACTCENPELHCYVRKEDDCSFTPTYPIPPNWSMV